MISDNHMYVTVLVIILKQFQHCFGDASEKRNKVHQHYHKRGFAAIVRLMT